MAFKNFLRNTIASGGETKIKSLLRVVQWSNLGPRARALAFISLAATVGIVTLFIVRADTSTNAALARQMLDNPNITYWTNNGVDTRDVVVALSQGRPAYTTCDNAPNKTTNVNTNLLRFLVETGKNVHIMVNDITDKCHAPGSKHYSGEAVDLDLNSENHSYIINTAAQFGGSRNDESDHMHFDFPCSTGDCSGASSTPTPIGGNPSANNDPKGVVDNLDCNRIVGWAFDPDNTGASIEVHIYIDGAGYNTGATAASRPDVNNVYGITGTHGFDWPVPGQYRDGRTHTVDVYAINTPSGGGNPKLRTGSIGPCGSVNRTPIGVTDSINCQSIAGWAFDPDRSDASIRVDVYMDGPAGQGTGVASFTANGSRPDVNSAYGITGNHGFSWPLASQYRDGRTHTAYLYAIGLDQNGATNGDNPQITAQPNNGVFGPCAAPTTTPTPVTPTPTNPTPTPTNPTPTNTTTTTTTAAKTIVGVASNRCLDVPGQNFTPATPVQLYDCNGTKAQAWSFPGNNAIQVNGNMCLDVNGGSTVSGAAVIIWPCHYQANQQWNRNADGTIRSVASGKCLDASGAGTANGTRLIIWDCHGGNNQKWR